MRKFNVLILVTLILLVATGCGTSKSTTTLDRIKADGKMTYAMSGQYPPFNFYNEKNELTGFDVEIGQKNWRETSTYRNPMGWADRWVSTPLRQCFIW